MVYKLLYSGRHGISIGKREVTECSRRRGGCWTRTYLGRGVYQLGLHVINPESAKKREQVDKHGPPAKLWRESMVVVIR